MLGDGLVVALGEPVTRAADADALGAGERVAATLAGAVHESSVSAKSRRSIAGR